MMPTIDARVLLVIGFILVTAGAVLPFLMVMRILESTLFLNFFSYAASILGLFLGLIGAATYVKSKRNNNRR